VRRLLSATITIGIVVLASSLISAGLIVALRPVLVRYALARPNARSSHTVPTPQGGGMAVVAAVLAVVLAAPLVTSLPAPRLDLAWVFGAVLALAVIGAVDDIRPLPPLLRLILQTLAVAAAVMTGTDARIVAAVPLQLEQALLIVGGVWFVNLVNFMDGLDLMTVAEIVPVTGALVLLGWLAELPAPATVAAAALFGAMLGFAPFNRPVAKIFLGDVGSLPIGLLAGWCLLQLAWHQQIAAALLLPLYYLADATVTLVRRIIRREPFWAAHRTHFYQRATDNGFSVSRVVSEVFALNILLAALAIGSAMTSSAAIAGLLLVVGGIATALLMHRFSRRQPSAV
jgi:UDP-N-acetylmuramyl pentapeptide phosphotransferase/UDP-N-acetylglucosamine-1-phosphate transferase